MGVVCLICGIYEGENGGFQDKWNMPGSVLWRHAGSYIVNKIMLGSRDFSGVSPRDVSKKLVAILSTAEHSKGDTF